MAPIPLSSEARDWPAQILDNRRTPCAVGLIRAAEYVATMPRGRVVEVWSRDRFAPIEIPVWAEREGHEVLQHRRQGWWPRRYFVVVLRRR